MQPALQLALLIAIVLPAVKIGIVGVVTFALVADVACALRVFLDHAAAKNQLDFAVSKGWRHRRRLSHRR